MKSALRHPPARVAPEENERGYPRVRGLVQADTDSTDGITGINVTPLVDIVLVLLIILLVAGAYVASRAIPMELPGTADSEREPPASLLIGVTANGELRLDGAPISRDALKPAVRRFVRDEPEGRAVIAAQRAASHGAVIGVVDLLRREGLSRLAFSPPPEP